MIVFRDIRFEAADFRGVELSDAGAGGGVRFAILLDAKYEERIESVQRPDRERKGKLIPGKQGKQKIVERVPLATPLVTTYPSATLARLDAATLYRAAGLPQPEWTKPPVGDV
jgi:hypothetical protein